MKNRLFLPTVVATALLCSAFQSSDASAADLGIGSKAPALDVESWLQDGNGFFKPVTDFKKGKVYVVEFWATWCGPCIGSMPHLATLQEKYRGDGVQIISISDETVDEVKDLMGKDHPDAGKTFAEITAAYCLTTDPDRSVYIDYMEASEQQGIPTAFIVGKDGLIEWIGHPGNMDEPLEKVVNDSWDREAFKKELKIQEELQENMQAMAELAGAGKFDEAIEMTNVQIKNAPNEMLKDHWSSVLHSLKLSSGKVDDETVDFYRGQIVMMKGDVNSLIRFGYSIYGVTQQGGEIGPLAGESIKALEAESESVADEAKPMYFNVLAMLNDADGNLPKAIAAQEAAIEAADDQQKSRLTPMLEQLKEKAAQSDEPKKEADAK
ncbi:Thiol-disulfide oxidoreductase ResA [Rubripirellula lacrimiformis]|uniref:Thiol-disulfide oxidoreductase ResA n=1 Tax=Rubripirellula lacrimiformis TaxID=1930273 RepID=A0A517NHJ8_9BACT|nr:TlpA disulfide reductase family protein [Rubripirellula lacrimiformis]QDT06523.1 Thiol-disulfide oxidoreductase ResA [Rubripirellula lacrimiformis]